MDFRKIALSVVLVLSSTFPAYADTTNEELLEMVKALKKRVEQLEAQLAQQTREIEQVEVTAINPATSGRLKLPEGIEFYGTAEVEVSSGKDHTGAASSDVTLSTVELGFDYSLADGWVTGSVVALHEDDDTDKWEIDQAFVRLGNPQSPLYVAAGRMYVPFGRYDTNMIADPLTLEIGETREAAVQVGFEKDGWYGSGYLFNGDMDDSDKADRIENYGFNIGRALESEHAAYDFGFSWINHLGDSDGVEGVLSGRNVSSVKDYVSAYGIHGTMKRGPWSFMGEYIAATKAFQANELPWKGKGAKPGAYHLEAGYDFTAFKGRESLFAVGLQGSRQSAGALPKRKLLSTLGTSLYDNTTLSVEYARAKDYGRSDGGTGKDGDSVTVQVAVEF